jgi:hypothetical protein
LGETTEGIIVIELDFTMDLAIRERQAPATGGVNAPWTVPSQARADHLR